MANAVSSNGYEDGGGGNGAAGSARPPRLPRWTRQEILVLIQGKKVAESRGRGRAGSRVHHMGAAASTSSPPLVGGISPVEPKWASVSSYCRKHGVNRGPVQCRKRWSNLAGDFKKIKEWELRRRSDGDGGGESFWVMRNDLRRERKLPGFFDREVYGILDGAAEVGAMAEVEVEEEGKEMGGKGEAVMALAAVEEDEEEAVFDSGRAARDDGLFSDFEQEQEDEEEERTPAAAAVAPVAATPISERKFEPFYPSGSDQGTASEKQPDDTPEKGTTSRDGNKRKRTSPVESGGETNQQNRLIEVLERNSRMLTAQLEAQNINSQFDRDQRKQQTNSVIEVLSNLADALGKIADKL